MSEFNIEKSFLENRIIDLSCDLATLKIKLEEEKEKHAKTHRALDKLKFRYFTKIFVGVCVAELLIHLINII